MVLYISNVHTEFDVCSLAIPERWMNFQKLKVGQCDLDFVYFWATFVLLIIFHSLQSICMINLNPVALTVREICTGVRKFKSRSPKLGHVPFDLAFACRQNYSSQSMHTKFEVDSFRHSRDIEVRIFKKIRRRPPSWIRPLVGFHNSAASVVPRSTILWNLNAIRPRAAELARCNRFSNCRTLGPQMGKWISELGGPSCTGSVAADIGAYTLLF